MASDYIRFPGYADRSVSSIADLRRIASTVPKLGDNTLVDGYATPGDGSGGIFVWSPTSLDADNDSSVIRPDDLGSDEPGRWKIVSLTGIATDHIPILERAAADVPNPPAGRQSIFLDAADHMLKRKASDGTVTIVDVGFGSIGIKSAAIDGNGHLIITRPDNTIVDCGPVKGADGANGLNGADGAAATVSIGSVTTATPGSSASVTNSGSNRNAVFNFAIPQGAKGDAGSMGDVGPGATVSIGSVDKGDTASVTNTGTATNALFNFVLPKGDQGIQGPTGNTGAAGSAATIAIGSVTTGAAGSSASVSNTGSPTAAVFDFTIPKGDKGDQGQKGDKGDVGATGPSLTDAQTLQGHAPADFYAASNPSNFLSSASFAAYYASLTNLDSSAGASKRFFSTGNITYGGDNATVSLYAYSPTGGQGASMAFLREGSYGIKLGLDQDNIFRLGGWSAGREQFAVDPNGHGYFYGNVTANNGNLYGGEIYARSWLRNSNAGCGLYNEATGQGILTVGSGNQGAGYGCVVTYGNGSNGWWGYAINSDMYLMSNLNNMRGIYAPNFGGWLVSWDNSGNATFAQNITAYSDERLKENIRPISDPWSIINGMTGIRYEKDGKTRVGLGAQTTRKVLPEVVLEADDLTKTLSVNYGDVIGPVIEALKDAYKKIETLTARVDELERKA